MKQPLRGRTMDELRADLHQGRRVAASKGDAARPRQAQVSDLIEGGKGSGKSLRRWFGLAVASVLLAGAYELGRGQGETVAVKPTAGVPFEDIGLEVDVERFTVSTSVSSAITQKLKDLDPKTKQDEIEKREGYKFGISASPAPFFDPFQHTPDTRDQRIGDGILIQPYERVKGLASPREYYAYLLDHLKSPDDASELASHDFIPYSKEVGRLRPGSEYLELGGADCEGASLMACEGLEALGKKNGKDYNPRVVTQDNLGPEGHAICVYEDDGKVHVIDQSPPYTPASIEEPVKITTLFVPVAENTGYGQEWVGPSGHVFNISLDNHLRATRDKLLVFFPRGTEFDYKNPNLSGLPDNWTSYLQTGMCFGLDPSEARGDSFPDMCAQFVTYVLGHVKMATYKEGSVSQREFDLGGDLSLEVYRGGNLIQRNFDDEGRVIQETFKSGPYQYIIYVPLLGTKTGYTFDGKVVDLK